MEVRTIRARDSGDLLPGSYIVTTNAVERLVGVGAIHAKAVLAQRGDLQERPAQLVERLQHRFLGKTLEPLEPFERYVAPIDG